MRFEPSGVPSLDRLLGGGLVLGDNVVWVGDEAGSCARFGQAFLAVGANRRRYVSLGKLADQVGEGIEVVHASPEGGCAHPVVLGSADTRSL